MADALLDSNVVVGARLKRDQWHDPGRAIVSGIDSGELPRGRLTSYNLPEILNPIEARAGDAPARRTLEFVTESRGLDVQRTTRDDYNGSWRGETQPSSQSTDRSTSRPDHLSRSSSGSDSPSMDSCS